MAHADKRKKATVGPHYGLVISVSSGNVAAAIASMFPGKPPVVLFSTHSELPVQDRGYVGAYEENLQGAIEEALHKLSKRTLIIPTHIFVSLSSPWILGQTRIVHHAKDLPFTITESLVKELLDTDRKRHLNELRERLGGEDISFIESRIFQTKINGYESEHPVGKSGREVEFVSYLSVMPTSVKKLLIDTIEHYYRAPLGFSSALLGAVASIPAAEAVHYDSYFLLDVGNELTELSFVQEGILRGTATFPFGRNYVVRQIMNEINHTSMEALSLLSLCVDGTLHSKVATHIDTILKNAEKEWQVLFQAALRQVTKGELSPKDVVILAPKTMATWIAHMIERSHRGAHGAFQAKVLEPQMLSLIVSTEREDHSSVPLLLSTAYLAANGV